MKAAEIRQIPRSTPVAVKMHGTVYKAHILGPAEWQMAGYSFRRKPARGGTDWPIAYTGYARTTEALWFSGVARSAAVLSTWAEYEAAEKADREAREAQYAREASERNAARHAADKLAARLGDLGLQHDRGIYVDPYKGTVTVTAASMDALLSRLEAAERSTGLVG